VLQDRVVREGAEELERLGGLAGGLVGFVRLVEAVVVDEPLRVGLVDLRRVRWVGLDELQRVVPFVSVEV